MWPPAIRFSSVVRCSNTRRPSKTCTTPRRTTAWGGKRSIRSPPNSIAPLVIAPRSEGSRPEIAFSVVVFPAPLAPSNVVIPASRTLSDTPLRTRITPS